MKTVNSLLVGAALGLFFALLIIIVSGTLESEIEILNVKIVLKRVVLLLLGISLGAIGACVIAEEFSVIHFFIWTIVVVGAILEVSAESILLPGLLLALLKGSFAGLIFGAEDEVREAIKEIFVEGKNLFLKKRINELLFTLLIVIFLLLFLCVGIFLEKSPESGWTRMLLSVVIGGLLLSLGLVLGVLAGMIFRINIWENNNFSSRVLSISLVLCFVLTAALGGVERRTKIITQNYAKICILRRNLSETISPDLSSNEKLRQENIQLQKKINQQEQELVKHLKKESKQEKLYQEKLKKIQQEHKDYLAKEKQALLLKEKQLQKLKQEKVAVLTKEFLTSQLKNHPNSFPKKEKNWQEISLQALLFTILPFLSATLLQYLLEEFLKKKKLGYVLIMLLACVVAQIAGYYFLIVSASMGCGAGSLLSQDRRSFSLR